MNLHTWLWAYKCAGIQRWWSSALLDHLQSACLTLLFPNMAPSSPRLYNLCKLWKGKVTAHPCRKSNAHLIDLHLDTTQNTHTEIWWQIRAFNQFHIPVVLPTGFPQNTWCFFKVHKTRLDIFGIFALLDSRSPKYLVQTIRWWSVDSPASLLAS